MSIKYIRFMSGENVIAELIEDNADTIVIRNPIVAIPGEQQGQMGFMPWAPLQDPAVNTITADKLSVIFITEAQPAIIEQYANMFGTIIAPTKQLIV